MFTFRQTNVERVDFGIRETAVELLVGVGSGDMVFFPEDAELPGIAGDEGRELGTARMGEAGQHRGAGESPRMMRV